MCVCLFDFWFLSSVLLIPARCWVTKAFDSDGKTKTTALDGKDFCSRASSRKKKYLVVKPSWLKRWKIQFLCRWMVLCILGTASFILCHIYQTTMDGFAFFTFVSVSQFDFVIRMYIETRYLSRRVRNTEWDQQQHRIRLCSNSGWYNGFLALPRLHIWIEENVLFFGRFHALSIFHLFSYFFHQMEQFPGGNSFPFFFSVDTLVCVCVCLQVIQNISLPS